MVNHVAQNRTISAVFNFEIIFEGIMPLTSAGNLDCETSVRLHYALHLIIYILKNHRFIKIPHLQRMFLVPEVVLQRPHVRRVADGHLARVGGAHQHLQKFGI